jgi:para-aminobenzoate synthetase/4-amino-4-deoxychorismate lyase
VRAIFPCGSITGAPKIRAMELIDAAERDARGLYCGAFGRIDPSGDAAFNVAIRTVRLDPRTDRAVMGVGSAVVADSAMLGEWRECVGDFLRLSAGNADLIETMAFDPAQGIALLELHLERIKGARRRWVSRSIAMPRAMPSMRCASIWKRRRKCGWWCRRPARWRWRHRRCPYPPMGR